MARNTSRHSTSRRTQSVILIFGESDNDRSALAELLRAIRPDLGSVSVTTLRKPLILMKEEGRRTTRQKTTDEIARLVRAFNVSKTVVAVIAHQDCDDIEPAHEKLTKAIEMELIAAGVPSPVAATPAWEIEAWWMLFPIALGVTRRCWAKVDYTGQHVGYIRNAKEVLRRDLRPAARRARERCPDYAESDGVTIATRIREMNLHTGPSGTSASFAMFVAKIHNLAVSE